MSKHKTHDMHRHSLSAYYAMKHSGAIKGRIYQILDLMADGLERTDRQIMEGLGYSDMNDVRPRISELLSDSHGCALVECGSVKLEGARAPVRLTKIAQCEQLEIF